MSATRGPNYQKNSDNADILRNRGDGVSFSSSSATMRR
jgi:hypothetical protein